MGKLLGGLTPFRAEGDAALFSSVAQGVDGSCTLAPVSATREDVHVGGHATSDCDWSYSVLFTGLGAEGRLLWPTGFQSIVSYVLQNCRSIGFLFNTEGDWQAPELQL